MKALFLVVGKTDDKLIVKLIDMYLKRLKHYLKFEIQELPDIKNSKNLSESEQKERETDELFKRIKTSDHVVLLDERGKTPSSMEFSKQIQNYMNRGTRQVVFIVGGPYGFSERMYERANEKLSLSKMTFSHQMVRLFFVEQVYRAMTILNNEPYHHE